MTDGGSNSLDGRSSGDAPEPAWWWTAEEHRNALIVLQLRLRRDILKFIASGPKSLEQICQRFNLSPEKADYHLRMLEAALVIKRCGEILTITPTGVLYLENVEARR
ncbi:MAG: winged helix-turn-helix domain-containing protein [Methanothrix sp.]|uniref:helix-turn-helix domain-containing protein n=1 Tax=Methanothrix sp. TaxID=90426 RepID=UPI003BB580C2